METKEYTFTQDWFSHNIPAWEKLKEDLKHKHMFLEIGSFEGRATSWIVENMMEDGGEIVCVDTWEGGEDHAPQTMVGALDRFKANLEIMKEKFPERKVIAYKGTAYKTLAMLIEKDAVFDFIYVDGSHTAWDVLTDACMAFGLLRSGGVMVFDDYMWGDPKRVLHRPKHAVDAFTLMFAEFIDVLPAGYQLFIRKK